MGVLTGPLFSLGASGTIAKTITYSRWKGIKYARQRVIPANPNTEAQQDVRNSFSYISELYKVLGFAGIQGLRFAVKGQPLTQRNLMAKLNQTNYLNNSSNAPTILSPGTSSMPAQSGMTVTPGANQLTIAHPDPTLPSGWSTDNFTVVVFPKLDPTTAPATPVVAHTAIDVSSPYSIVVTGLTTGTLYVAVGWFETLQASPIVYAYTPSESGSGTPT